MDFPTLLELLKREMCPMRMMRMLNTLEQLKTSEETFKYFWSFDEVHKCLNLPVMPQAKSNEDSLLMRVEGNAHYKEKRYEDALECYNQSIVLAPHPAITSSGSHEVDIQEYRTLADGYLNRSAVLLVLKEFDKCLMDLDLASKCTYSDLMVAKIKERREKCLKTKAEVKVMDTKQMFVSNNTKTPPEIVEPNKSVPVFSDYVRIEHSPTIGRHVVATRNIRPGELIAVEKSYCSRMFFHMEQIFCPVCLMPCPMPVPCPSCNLVFFCSDTCRMTGIKEHLRECRILPFMDLLGLNNNTEASLALKTLIQATFVELRDTFPILQKEAKKLPPEKLGFNEEGIFKSDEYRTAFHLANTRRKVGSGNYYLSCCTMAYLLTRILLDSGTFYVDRTGKPFTPSHSDLMLTGTALLHHLCIYPNVFCLSDLIVSAPANKTFKKVVGEALFPALMSLRHSCDAPTAHYTFGHVRIVKACCPISAGEEVTLCYGGKFQRNPLPYRKIHLETYGIFCRCVACENEWPSYPDVTDELRFKCIKCTNPLGGELTAPSCSTCNIDFSKTKFKGEKRSFFKKFWTLVDRVREADKIFHHIDYKIKTNRVLSIDDFKQLCYYIELLHRHVTQPCMAMSKARDAMLIFFYKDNKFVP